MNHPLPTIELVVSPTGETRLETRGFAGGACRSASQFLEAAMGRRTGEQLTADFYRAAATQPLPQQGGTA